MLKRLLMVLGLVSLPGLAGAQPGSGTDRDRVSRQVEIMQQDGRWEQAIAEGRANKRAFEEMQRRNQSTQRPTAAGSGVVRTR